MDAEVGIIGLGTMGSMAAWQLAKKGVTVLGFEKFGIGNDRTAGGGESRLFRTAYMEGPEYVPLLQKAKTLWRDLEKESQNSLLTLNGGLMIGEDGTPEIKAIMESIQEFQLEHEILHKEAAKNRFPQFKLYDNDVIVLDKNAGFIRPELAIVSAAYQAKKYGAELKTYATVEQIIPGDHGVEIISNGKTFKVNKVIVTTGAWSGKLLPELKDQLIPRRLLLTWFAPKNHDLVHSNRLPIFARMRGDYRLTGAPTLDGTMVKASYTKDPLAIDDPNLLYRDVYPEEIAILTKSVEKLLPVLYPEPVRATPYMDAYTPDNHAMLGALPNFKNVLIASGFSGHGFKLSPTIGQIISELIVNGKTNDDISHLDPNRLTNN